MRGCCPDHRLHRRADVVGVVDLHEVVAASPLLAVLVDGVQTGDARPKIVGQRVEPVRRAREAGGDGRGLHLEPVERDRLHGVLAPHHVAVEQQLTERGVAVLLVAVGDVVLVEVALCDRGRAVGGSLVADEKAGEVPLILRGQLTAEQEEGPLVERGPQRRDVVGGKLTGEVEADDLGTERGAQLSDFETGHGLALLTDVRHGTRRAIVGGAPAGPATLPRQTRLRPTLEMATSCGSTSWFVIGSVSPLNKPCMPSRMLPFSVFTTLCFSL